MKHRYIKQSNLPDNLMVQGNTKMDNDWLCVDLGSIIVHCFTKESRVKYDLDGLWTTLDSTDPFKHTLQDYLAN